MVCGNVCCVVVVEHVFYFSLGVLKYSVCLCRGYERCCVFCLYCEAWRLNRRQRCTLSQLRSGPCHLLQDYKHWVFGRPSFICTDCGASPQDVRHLFACNKHPTDLSPEDLWRNPVRQTSLPDITTVSNILYNRTRTIIRPLTHHHHN